MRSVATPSQRHIWSWREDMLLPSQLAVKPQCQSIALPEYQFEGQNRWDGTVTAMSYSSSSTQTFDYKGNPKDSRGDNND
jgi:hypothetical protein